MDVKTVDVSYLVAETPPSSLPVFSSKKNTSLLLDKVSLSLPPGSVTAIFGVGKGYVSILECIALRQYQGQLAGRFVYDGTVRKLGFYKDIALVDDSEQAHYGSLHLFDYLYYGARLRTAQDATECRERARQVCRLVGLDGTVPMCKLCPTEVRIASIAVEIVANPTLVVAVDPTRGLDAAGALEVLKVLRTVSKRVTMRTTVVYSLPSLSEDMLPLTDYWSIFLGNTVRFSAAVTDFSGEVHDELVAAWTDLSHLLLKENAHIGNEKSQENIQESDGVVQMERVFQRMDALIDRSAAFARAVADTTTSHSSLTHHNNTTGHSLESKSDDLEIEHGRFKGGIYPRLSSAGVYNLRNPDDLYAVTRKLGESDGGLPVRQPKPLYMELWILLERSALNHYRNITHLTVALVLFGLAALLLGCLALRQGDDLDAADLVSSPSTGLVDMHAYNVSGLLFAAVALSLVCTAYTVPYLHSAMHLIRTDVAAGLASTVGGWLTLTTVDLCLLALAVWPVSLLVHVLVDLQGALVTYCWALFLVTFCGYSLAAVCVVWCRHVRTAWSLFAALSTTSLLFAGFLQRLDSLGGLWSLLAQLSFARWGYEAVMVEAFWGAPDREDYLELFGFDNTKALYCTVWLVLWFLMLQVLVLLGLIPPAHNLKIATALRKQLNDGTLDNADGAEGSRSDPLNSLNLKERMDAIWEAAKVIAQRPVRSSGGKRRRRSRGGKRKSDASATPEAASPAEGGYQPPILPNEDDEDDVALRFENMHTQGNPDKTGYQPPVIHGEGGENEVTLQFENVHTLFGPGMRLHSIEPTAVAGVAAASPPLVAKDALQKAPSYSARIRNKTNMKMGPTTQAHDTFTSPTKVPLLAAEEALASGTVSPMAPVLSPLLPPSSPPQARRAAHPPSSTRSDSAFTAGSLDRAESQQRERHVGQVIPIPPQMATTLTFSRVKFVAEGYEHAAPSLQGISYKLSPGTCCCVLDGAGEDSAATLLVQVLGGKLRTAGKTTGVICVNDQRLSAETTFFNAAYVPRGDVTHVNALTVRQVLRYAAYLRRTDQAEVSSVELLRSHYSGEGATSTRADLRYEGAPAESLVGRSHDAEQRVHEVLAMMGLEEVADLAVGSPGDSAEVPAVTPRAPVMLRNLAQLRHGQRFGLVSSAPDGEARSGGRALTAAEVRCLTIGTELVNRPGLVFLEDPFADLQWQDSEKVAAVLQNLARGGRTVLCSVEKPCQLVVSHFSDLMLLGAGLLVYSGKADAVATYFANIGFERPLHQNDLDFVLDIAADRGKMKLVGGKRSNPLSPEDLADLNRSLVNIQAGRKKEEDAHIAQEGVDGIEGGAVSGHSAGHTAEHNQRSLRLVSTPPMGATAAVLVARGLHVHFRNRTQILRHCGQAFTAGVALGSVWWRMNEGNYQTRLSLLATAYVAMNIFTVDSVADILKRKQGFERELSVGATTHSAYVLSDCIATYVLYALGTFLFCLPLYVMSQLRPGLGYFLCFYTLLLTAVYGNLCLAYLVTAWSSNRSWCQLVYGGVLLPLQFLLSGYPLLIRTMPPWLGWGAAINPMYFYMAGMFRNEFLHNRSALGDASYSNLSTQFSYYSLEITCLVVLTVIGAVYKGCWYAALRLDGKVRHRSVLKKVQGARRKARKLIKAGLRWREGAYAAAPAEGNNSGIPPMHNGIFEIGDDEDIGEVDLGNPFHHA